MGNTKINLDLDTYNKIKLLAENSGKTIFALVRDLVNDDIQRQVKEKSPVVLSAKDFIGVFKYPDDRNKILLEKADTMSDAEILDAVDGRYGFGFGDVFSPLSDDVEVRIGQREAERDILCDYSIKYALNNGPDYKEVKKHPELVGITRQGRRKWLKNHIGEIKSYFKESCPLATMLRYGLQEKTLIKIMLGREFTT